MGLLSRSIVLLLGVTACSISGYLLYHALLKKDDTDEEDDVDSPVSCFRTVEVKIPKDLLRTLIGRNGKTIKQIQEQSGTRISFKDHEEFKICLIRGSSDNCNIAQELIRDFIANQPVLESEDVWVPNICIAKIIGRGGSKIMEMRSMSGAKITVSDFGDDRNGDSRTLLSSRRIIIKGTKEQILVAKSLIDEIAQEALKSQQKVENFLSKREPRLPLKSPERRAESPKVERISPVPGQPDAQFEVYVSAMVDPSKFWLQIVGPKASELDCLVEEMTDYYGKAENRSSHLLENVQKGDLVAAVFQYDKKWYRAEVLNVLEEKTPKKAELYYVDYGDTDTVPCDELFELRTDFLRLHFQAIECFLARVDPVGESWSEEAVDRFEEWTHVAQWKKLSAKINGYGEKKKVSRAKREGSPVPGVDLFDITNERDLDVAEELVKAGLAVFKKEAELMNGSCSRATSVSNISIASSS